MDSLKLRMLIDAAAGPPLTLTQKRKELESVVLGLCLTGHDFKDSGTVSMRHASSTRPKEDLLWQHPLTPDQASHKRVLKCQQEKLHRFHQPQSMQHDKLNVPGTTVIPRACSRHEPLWLHWRSVKTDRILEATSGELLQGRQEGR